MLDTRNKILTSSALIAGGLDLVTAPLVMKPGRSIAGLNYECCDSGLRRIDGHERFDGQPRPSQQSYSYLAFSSGNAALTTGQVVTGVTSGATGKLLIDQVATSGTFGGGDAAGYMVLGVVSGTFEFGENLQVGGVTKAVAAADSIPFGAPTDADNTTWARLAIATARALIQPVPGEGRILGVWMYKGVVYAWRNNVGSTAAVMHKSTTAGWAAVDTGLTLAFTSGGTTEIIVGNTITGATSGATAVIGRVILLSGTWAGGDAAGYFIFASKTGNFVAENLNVGASLNLATIAGNAAAITFAPSGRFEFANKNFYGNTGGERMYGCDGVSKAFEFDGTMLTPITTGQAVDTPIHLAVHRNRLYLAFRGGVFDCSITGSPTVFDGILGSAEFGVGYEITGLVGEILDNLFVFSTEQTKVLYGSSADPAAADPFVLKTLSTEAGAVEWSMQNVGQLTYLDAGGVRNVSATQSYGDFSVGTLTESVRPFIDQKVKLGYTVTASIRSKRKTHYRVFFSDGQGLTLYLGKTKTSWGNVYPQPEPMPFDLGKVVRCCCSVEDTTGLERMFFGSDDGYIYEHDAGTSNDGSALESYTRLAFDSCRSPSQDKRFTRAMIEVDKVAVNPADGSSSASLFLSAEFSYALPDQPPVQQQAFTLSGGGGFWNEANWNEFYWDQPAFGQAVAYIDGLGRNISMSIFCTSTYEQPHILHGYELQYSPRRLSR